MVTEPTRPDNVLDLFLTTNQTLINEVNCQPGLSDHDMVTAVGSLKPVIQKQKPRKIHLFRKADWPRLKAKMRMYQESFLAEYMGKSVEKLWNDFTSTLESSKQECIPMKTVRGKPSLPWITQEIKRMIRKRDSLYIKFKKSGKMDLKNQFQALRQKIKRKIKDSYQTYLEISWV